MIIEDKDIRSFYKVNFLVSSQVNNDFAHKSISVSQKENIWDAQKSNRIYQWTILLFKCECSFKHHFRHGWLPWNSLPEKWFSTVLFGEHPNHQKQYVYPNPQLIHSHTSLLIFMYVVVGITFPTKVVVNQYSYIYFCNKTAN